MKLSMQQFFFTPLLCTFLHSPNMYPRSFHTGAGMSAGPLWLQEMVTSSYSWRIVKRCPGTRSSQSLREGGRFSMQLHCNSDIEKYCEACWGLNSERPTKF